MRIRRLATAVAAVATALAGGLLAAPTAQAAPGNIVLFGDSLLANPPFTFTDVVNPGYTTGFAPHEGRCARGNDRVGSALQQRTGIRVEDYACTGAAAYGPISGGNVLSSQVDTALNQRALHGGTRHVSIQIGINDTYKGPGLYEDQKRAYVGAIQAQVGRIRAAAPNAKIQILGYPEVTDAAGRVCPINMHGLPDLGFPFGPVVAAEGAVGDWQRAAARATGAEFLDLRAATRGHGMCANDQERWMVGILDNRSKPYNITTHLTHEGNHRVAAIIAGTIR